MRDLIKGYEYWKKSYWNIGNKKINKSNKGPSALTVKREGQQENKSRAIEPVRDWRQVDELEQSDNCKD